MQMLDLNDMISFPQKEKKLRNDMQQIVGTSYYGEGKFAGEGDLSSGGFNEVELWVIFILCMFVFFCIKKIR